MCMQVVRGSLTFNLSCTLGTGKPQTSFWANETLELSARDLSQIVRFMQGVLAIEVPAYSSGQTDGVLTEQEKWMRESRSEYSGI